MGKPRQCPVAQAKALCNRLQLHQVKPSSWELLRQAECALFLDLQADVEHCSASMLHALDQAITAVAAESAELWDWLILPASDEDSSLPRLRALLVLLGQACSSGGELAAAAGSAYMSLLAVQGADQQWSILFQPAIFRQILVTLRALRRGDLKPKRDTEDLPMDAEDVSMEADAKDSGSHIPFDEAFLLLSSLSTFLHQRGFGSSLEAHDFCLDELAALMLRPAEERVAREASASLAFLVARSDDVRKVAAAAMRAVMPAVLMTQERGVVCQTGIPKPLQQGRAVSLNFIRMLMRSHPELLQPQATSIHVEVLKDAEDERPRKRAKKAEEGEGDIEAAAEDDEEEEKPSSRRRRPRGCGIDDPVVAFLELICYLTPDRSEWRTSSADSVLTLLVEAADVERQIALAARSEERIASRRLPGKTKDPAWERQQEDSASYPLPLQDGSAVEGAIVATSEDGCSAQASAVDRFLSFLEKMLENERVACRVLATEVAVAAVERSGRLARWSSKDSHGELVKRLMLALVRRSVDAVPTVRTRALNGVAAALQFLARFGDSGQLLRHVALEKGHSQYVDLASLFKAASSDEKPTVRRAALFFFDAALPLLSAPLGLDGARVGSFFEVELMHSLSADESVLVRKSSVSSVALLLRSCPLPFVCQLWVRSVLPLILDVEGSVSDRALDELEAAVIAPIAETNQALPLVLSYLDSEATEYLQRGLRLLAKRNDGQLPKRFVTSLMSIAKDCVRLRPPYEWPTLVWSMLEEIATMDRSNGMELDFVMKAWLQLAAPAKASTNASFAEGRDSILGTKVLRVLEQLVHLAAKDQSAVLLQSIKDQLFSMEAPASLIRAMMCLLQKVEDTSKNKKLAASNPKGGWMAAMAKAVQASLADAVRGELPVNTSRLASCLFTLGELAMVDASIISESIVAQVQTIATNTIWREGQRIDVDATIRGHAFAALGKLCLKKESLAKKSVELLVLHLNCNESFIVRNNVLIVLGDLCAHYTSLVDRFVPYLTNLLRDQNQLLRKQATMILASLLAEDYIKLRGSILLRFLYVLSDPSDHVRGFAECVFARILHQRNSMMFSQNFLDVICALNGWAGLTSFQAATGNEEFCLQRQPGRRAMIYKFMLALMSSDQKFNVCAQIVTTLLAAFVDSEDKIDLPATVASAGGQALSDGLALLCCKEMRICFTTQRASQDDEEIADGDKSKVEAARGVLSSILKRNMCENIVPVLVQLKNLMEAKHSPFLGQLRHCLREILRDFKDDLKVMLACDPQLAAEIAFDLQEQASSEKSEPKPLLPALNGGSRRVSLGRMMKTTTPCRATATPIADVCHGLVTASPSTRRAATSLTTIPKARRSLDETRSAFQTPSSDISKGQAALQDPSPVQLGLAGA